MRTLQLNEIDEVNGAGSEGYVGAGAVLTVLATGAAIAAAPITVAVVGLALGAAAGLAAAQWLANNT